MREGEENHNGTVITLYGSLGCVGRTTVAVNLAAALAQSGHKVALVDLDIRFGDVAILLDIAVEQSIADLPTEDGRLSVEMSPQCLYGHHTGVTVLPAPVRPTDWQTVGAAHVERAVALLTQTYDWVILDSPKSYKVLSAALEAADSLVMVTTGHESSLEATKHDLRMLAWLCFPGDRIRLVVNATNEHTDIEPEDIERILGRHVFWSVPYDRNISTATQLGTPLVLSHPQSRAARSISDLTKALAQPNNVQDYVQAGGDDWGATTGLAGDRPKPFHAYLASIFLSPLPWRRQWLIIGRRRCNAARVVAAARNAYVCAAAIGRAKPDFVPRFLDSSCQPGTWRRVYSEAAAQVRSRMDAVAGSPSHFDQLLPEDFDTDLLETAAPFDLAYALTQIRVVEGLVLGREHPELTGKLLHAEFRSVVQSLELTGRPLPRSVTSVEDFQQHLLALAAAW